MLRFAVFSEASACVHCTPLLTFKYMYGLRSQRIKSMERLSSVECDARTDRRRTDGCEDALGRRVPTAIWLILPELMCSFQRLSHACISITCQTGKLRTAHYTRHNLLDLDKLTWITVVILELIHAPKLRSLVERSAFVRHKTKRLPRRSVLTQNN